MFYRHLHAESCVLSREGEEAPKSELQALRDERDRLITEYVRLFRLGEPIAKMLSELSILPIGCSREQELAWKMAVKNFRHYQRDYAADVLLQAALTPAGQRWTRRKILAVHGGHYEEYEENYYWVPDDFSWARLADAIQKRKGLLNPDRKKMFFAHEVLERALLAVGCKPVISDLRLCTDGFMVDWDVDDSGEMTRLSYDPINRFTDELLKRGPLTPNEATE